jgi:probable F420-dependent oxidoreductase
VRIAVATGNMGFAFEHPPGPADHAARCLELVTTAEALGFHVVTFGDHLALPTAPSTPYPYGPGWHLDPETSLLDPFALMAAAAARTSRVLLAFGVLVLPYRSPLVTAKLVATIDAIANGRVVIGVGSGWLPEEFAAVGADFAERGRQTTATLRYLTEVFATGSADGLRVLPTPVQRPRPRIWVGGRSPAAMRRAVALADGWSSPYSDPDQLASDLATLRRLCREADRAEESLEVSVHGIVAASIDHELVERYRALGVCEIGAMLPVGDRRRCLEELRALAGRCASLLEPAPTA